MASASGIAEPLVLQCGQQLRNRLAKAAMTEHMADPQSNLPNEKHMKLYEVWADGGLGMSITGNVQVDRRYLEGPRNVVLEKDTPLEKFSEWAEVCKKNGCMAIMQISHAGRQCPSSVCSQPLCPSMVPLKMPGLPSLMTKLMIRQPREMTLQEIEDVVDRFATTAQRAEEAGFNGVQVHSAHGYLLSAFLSPHTNRRKDEYGGSPENRRKLLLKIVGKIRERVSKGFVVMVKVNSADFQRGGFEEDESLEVLKALEGQGVDLVEISGGTYEKMEAMQTVKESTRQREAFFLDFAKKARACCTLPLMLTGGFSSATAMNDALDSKAVDVIGLARPLCTNPDGPKQLMNGEISALTRHAPVIGIRYVDDSLGAAFNNFWHNAHMRNLAKGAGAVRPEKLRPSILKMLLLDMTFTYIWDPQRNPSKTRCIVMVLASLLLLITTGAVVLTLGM